MQTRQQAQPSDERLPRALGRKEDADAAVTGGLQQASAAGPAAAQTTSTPAAPDIVSLQRSIGNRAVGRLLQARRANPGANLYVQRDDTKDKKEVKYPGPPPANPFDMTPAIQARIDSLTIDALKTLTTGQVGRAYTDYLHAIGNVRQEQLAKKKEAQEKQEKMMEMVLTVGLLALGPATKALGAAITGPTIRGTILSNVEKRLPGTLQAAGIDANTAMGMTAEAYNKLASDSLEHMAKEFTAEKAAEAVGKAQEKLAGKIAKMSFDGGPYDAAVSFLDALAKAADGSDKALLNTISALNDFSELAGVYNAFNSATLEVYEAQLRGQADHFVEQLADVKATTGRKGQIVKINAYGQERLAHVHYLSDSANYAFHGWVTPDMEPIARQIEPNPQEITPQMIAGHLPDPVREVGDKRIVSIDAWGKERLAIVRGEYSWFSHSFEGAVFVSWVPSDGEEVARAQGEQQIGGLNRIPAAEVHGLRAPDAA